MGISEIEIKYETDSLETGNYRIYHSTVDVQNIMSNSSYTEIELYNGVTFNYSDFPISLVNLLEQEKPIIILINKDI
jgi:hypothetical protein